MIRIFFFAVLMLLLLVACDDGDIVISPLTFDDAKIENSCGNIILFKISKNKKEALIMELDAKKDGFFTKAGNVSFTINNKTNKVVYRIFDAEVSKAYFCQDIPPTTPLVIEEWHAPSGTIQIETTFKDDDKDGIPTDQEGVVYNDDKTINQAASRDTDKDGFPDYIDNDDDGDNILTANEISFDDQKQLIFTDTDGDGIPNYLDADDDNDGVNTIDEDINGDGNPTNDTTVVDGETTANYLTPTTAIKTTNKFGRKKNEYQRIYTSTINITDGFQLINSDNQKIKYDVDKYHFGTVETPVSQVEK